MDGDYSKAFKVLNQELECILVREPEFKECSSVAMVDEVNNRLLVQYTAIFERKDGGVMGQQCLHQYPLPLNSDPEYYGLCREIVREAHEAAHAFLEAHRDGLGGFHVLDFAAGR